MNTNLTKNNIWELFVARVFHVNVTWEGLNEKKKKKKKRKKRKKNGFEKKKDGKLKKKKQQSKKRTEPCVAEWDIREIKRPLAE